VCARARVDRETLARGSIDARSIARRSRSTLARVSIAEIRTSPARVEKARERGTVAESVPFDEVECDCAHRDARRDTRRRARS
jgi:hypothetical protein